jgi:hypothetical protein
MLQCIVHIDNVQQNFHKIKVKGQDKSCFLTLDSWMFSTSCKKVFKRLQEGV